MRIKEGFHDGYEAYSYLLQKKVEEIFRYTSQITEIKKLLAEIRGEAGNLQSLFWTEEELKERTEITNLFDARIQATVYYTLKNIEGYRQHGWKELIYEGENRDE